jgi:hypothetical protein
MSLSIENQNTTIFSPRRQKKSHKSITFVSKKNHNFTANFKEYGYGFKILGRNDWWKPRDYAGNDSNVSGANQRNRQ